MKILFISHTTDRSGAELGLFELILALRKKEVKCTIVVPRPGRMIEDFEKTGLDYKIIPFRWWVSKDKPLLKKIYHLTANLISAVKIGLLAKKLKCDFIYTSTIAIPVGVLAAKLFNIPHIWHIHEFGFEDHGLIFDLGEKFSYWTMNNFSVICFVNSKAVRRKFKKYIDPNKIKVAYYSVTFPEWLAKPPAPKFRPEGLSCLIIGQIQEGKRQEEAIRAIAELQKMGIKVKLSIAGEGDLGYKKRILKIIKKKKLKKLVTFLGYHPDPLEFYRNADIVLMCSRSEAFGRVTIEAMKMGRPVIGADAGGTSELIKNGFNGFLYKPGNYKDLAQKIKYLAENPKIRRKMGINSQKYALHKFTLDNYGSSVYQFLKSLQ